MARAGKKLKFLMKVIIKPGMSCFQIIYLILYKGFEWSYFSVRLIEAEIWLVAWATSLWFTKVIIVLMGGHFKVI